MSCAGKYCAAKAVGAQQSDSARDRTGESPQMASRVRKPFSRIARAVFHELRRQILRRESHWRAAIRFGARSDGRIAANGVPCSQIGFKNRSAPFFMSCAGKYYAASRVSAAIRFGARSDGRIAASGVPCSQTGFKNRPAPFFHELRRQILRRKSRQRGDPIRRAIGRANRRKQSAAS